MLRAKSNIKSGVVLIEQHPHRAVQRAHPATHTLDRNDTRHHVAVYSCSDHEAQHARLMGQPFGGLSNSSSERRFSHACSSTL
jgi:hypothetical protein